MEKQRIIITIIMSIIKVMILITGDKNPLNSKPFTIHNNFLMFEKKDLREIVYSIHVGVV